MSPLLRTILTLLFCVWALVITIEVTYTFVVAVRVVQFAHELAEVFS